MQLTINTDFLEALEPPTSFPPNQQELNIQLQNKFLSQCQKFISNEKLLYRCSKSIQTRLKTIINNSQSIRDNLASQKMKFNDITRQLQKYKDKKDGLKQREKMLKMLCDLMSMQELRKDLLLQKEQDQPKGKKIVGLVNEDDYLSKLQKLAMIIEESDCLNSFSQEFPLIKDILNQLESIFERAVGYLLRELMTPLMVELSFNKYSHIFFNNNKNNTLFYQAMVRNRVQHIKINLNPMINSLNYATNIPQLYQSILTTWITLLRQQVTMLQHSQQFSILKTANDQLINQLIPKMEKNMFRIKELVQVIRIRKYFHVFRKQFLSITQIQSQQPMEKQDSVLALICKSQAVLQSMMTEQAESLQNAKYNIYTLVSYIPIRQHLQRIKQCYEYSIEPEQIEWQAGFHNLFSSRDPKNYPNNKSLIIFNLNIWYLYLKVVPKGKYTTEGAQLLKWCKSTFTNINVAQTNKRYFESFEKILEIGGNMQAFKNTLYAEIQLLGHEELRRQIAHSIKQKYLDSYTSILAKIEKKPMSNEEVKAFCQQKKINLNKFGKFSQTVCICSREELDQELNY